MKNILLPFLVFLISLEMFAQTPCDNGFAGLYPCYGFDLLSNIPISTLANTTGTPEGSDIWGWTDSQTGKEYALVATTNSTAFVDITNPVNPIFLGRLDSENGNTSYWRDVKVYNNHAFIVGDNVGNHGMQVFDLTKLRNVTSPQSFSSDAVFTGVSSCHNIVINESKAVAYLVGCNTYSGGVHFVDISNPTSPQDLGGYAAAGYTHDAQVVTYNGPDTEHLGKEIYIGSNENKVVILDVTDPSNVIELSTFTYSQTKYTHQNWLTENHRYLFIGDELDEVNFGNNTKTIIADLQDLDNPSFSFDYYGTTEAIDHNGYVKGNWFYIANYRAGLRVIDISALASDPSSINEIGFFDTYPSNNGSGFNGLWSVYPFFDSGNIILSDIESGLFVVKANETLSNEEFVKESFSLYPNPTSNYITVSAYENTPIETVEIYSLSGRRVFKKLYPKSLEVRIPLSSLAKGVYFLKANSVVQKLIVN